MKEGNVAHCLLLEQGWSYLFDFEDHYHAAVFEMKVVWLEEKVDSPR